MVTFRTSFALPRRLLTSRLKKIQSFSSFGAPFWLFSSIAKASPPYFPFDPSTAASLFRDSLSPLQEASASDLPPVKLKSLLLPSFLCFDADSLFSQGAMLAVSANPQTPRPPLVSVLRLLPFFLLVDEVPSRPLFSHAPFHGEKPPPSFLFSRIE